jgi:cysteine desulfurase/selenocysteine lyase
VDRLAHNPEVRTLDVQLLRRDFPSLQQMVHGKPLIYLDNAATTHKPRAVIAKVVEYYEQYTANVHRGIYASSVRATEEYEAAREKVARFINAAESRSIIFTKGTTDAINLVALTYGRQRLQAGDEILLTEMEHHSNLVPWQLLAREKGVRLRFIPFLPDGTLDLSDPARYFTSRTKLVSVIHQSNVFGTLNPVKRLVSLAHSVNAPILIDAAQSVPHIRVDVQGLDCDFLAFSGHKMLGPTGIGVLYGKSHLLESLEPFQGGGEMISTVTLTEATWNEIPYKFEAGTPNIAQAIGLGAAVDYLQAIDFEALQAHEKKLAETLLDAIKSIPGVTVYGNAANRGPVLSFNVDGIHPHDVAQFLDQDGIAIRAGHHCAQPIMEKLGVAATNRVSLYLYNQLDDLDALCESLEKTINFLKS